MCERHSAEGLVFATLLRVHFIGFSVELSSEIAKLPLGLWVFGAVGNIATFFGALAECVPV